MAVSFYDPQDKADSGEDARQTKVRFWNSSGDAAGAEYERPQTRVRSAYADSVREARAKERREATEAIIQQPRAETGLLTSLASGRNRQAQGSPLDPQNPPQAPQSPSGATLTQPVQSPAKQRIDLQRRAAEPTYKPKAQIGPTITDGDVRAGRYRYAPTEPEFLPESPDSPASRPVEPEPGLDPEVAKRLRQMQVYAEAERLGVPITAPAKMPDDPGPRPERKPWESDYAYAGRISDWHLTNRQREGFKPRDEDRPFADVESDVRSALDAERLSGAREEAGLSGRATFAAKRAAVSGIGTTTTDLYAGIARLANTAENAIRTRVGASRRDYDPDKDLIYNLLDYGTQTGALRDQLSQDPLAGGWEDMLAQGLGSTAGFASTGWLSTALKTGRFIPIAVTGSAVNTEQLYSEALDMGASQEDAEKMALWSVLAGSLEAVPISRAFGRFEDAYDIAKGADRATKGRFLKTIIKHGVGEGFEESLQEVTQQGVNNYAIARYIDENRSVFDGMLESGGVGGSVGTLMGVLFSAAGVRRARFDTPEQRQAAFDEVAKIAGEAADRTQANVDRLAQRPDLTEPAETRQETTGIDESGQERTQKPTSADDSIPPAAQAQADEQPGDQRTDEEYQSLVEQARREAEAKKAAPVAKPTPPPDQTQKQEAEDAQQITQNEASDGGDSARMEAQGDEAPAVQEGRQGVQRGGRGAGEAEAQVKPASPAEPASKGDDVPAFSPNLPQYSIYGVNVGGKTMYAIRTKMDNFRGTGDELHETLEQAERGAEDMRKRDAAKAEAEVRAEAERKAKDEADAKAKAERKDLDGFADDLPDIQRRRIESVLNKTVRSTLLNRELSRKELIKDAIENRGAKIETIAGKKRLVRDDGTIIDGGAPTTEIKYAEHLISQKESAQKDTERPAAQIKPVVAKDATTPTHRLVDKSGKTVSEHLSESAAKDANSRAGGIHKVEKIAPSASAAGQEAKAEPPKHHVVIYNGKVASMDYVSDAKNQFRLGARRISDNGAEGYVVTPNGEVFKVAQGSRKAKRVTGAEADQAIQMSANASPAAQATAPDLAKLSKKDLITRMRDAGLKPKSSMTKTQMVEALEGKAKEPANQEKPEDKQARTTIPKPWHGQTLYAWKSDAAVALKKGAAKIKGRRTLPIEYHRQLKKVPKSAKRLIDRVKELTGEWINVEGKYPHFLAPPSAVTQAKQDIPDWRKDVEEAERAKSQRLEEDAKRSARGEIVYRRLAPAERERLKDLADEQGITVPEYIKRHNEKAVAEYEAEQNRAETEVEKAKALADEARGLSDEDWDRLNRDDPDRAEALSIALDNQEPDALPDWNVDEFEVESVKEGLSSEQDQATSVPDNESRDTQGTGATPGGGQVAPTAPQGQQVKTSGQQLGLTGIGPEGAMAGGITGSKSGALFAPRETTSKASEADEQFRKEQTPKDAETSEMFGDQSLASRLNAKAEADTKREYKKPTQIESASVGSLNQARELKKRAWNRVKAIRQKLRDAPEVGGNRGQIRLELMRAEESHQEALRMERGAKEAIEKRANELGQTTVKKTTGFNDSDIESKLREAGIVYVPGAAIEGGIYEKRQQSGAYKPVNEFVVEKETGIPWEELSAYKKRRDARERGERKQELDFLASGMNAEAFDELQNKKRRGLAEDYEDKADKALENFKKNQPKGGDPRARGGSTIGKDLAYLSQYVAYKTAAMGVRRGKALVDAVKKLINEVAPHYADRWKDVEKRVRRLHMASLNDDGTVDQERFEREAEKLVAEVSEPPKPPKPAAQPEPDDRGPPYPTVPDEKDKPEGDFPPDTFSARQAQVNQDRERWGKPGLQSRERRTWSMAVDTARKRGFTDPDRAMAKAASVIERPRALDDVETAGLVEHGTKLKREHARLQSEIGKTDDPAVLADLAAQINRVEQDFEVLTNALFASGSEKGRALASQKLTLNMDMDLVSVLNRAKAAKGKKLTDKERSQLEQMTNKHEEYEKKIEELQARIDELMADRTARANSRRRYAKMNKAQKDADLRNRVSRVAELLKAGCD